MSIPAIGTSLIPTAPALDSAKTSAGGFGKSQADGPFGTVIQGLLEKANAPHVEADQALQQLVTGQTENVHDVVMSVVKADMSFRFILELRNRLTDAYQEVMRMQV
jgi:flagellar hook-basal body complex protein FliE